MGCSCLVEGVDLVLQDMVGCKGGVDAWLSPRLATINFMRLLV